MKCHVCGSEKEFEGLCTDCIGRDEMGFMDNKCDDDCEMCWMSELKPCPWCGVIPPRVQTATTYGTLINVHVGDCPMTSINCKEGTLDCTDEAWNTRHESSKEKCPECHYVNPDWVYCPNCGRKIDE